MMEQVTNLSTRITLYTIAKINKYICTQLERSLNNSLKLLKKSSYNRKVFICLIMKISENIGPNWGAFIIAWVSFKLFSDLSRLPQEEKCYFYFFIEIAARNPLKVISNYYLISISYYQINLNQHEYLKGYYIEYRDATLWKIIQYL